uniref:Sleeping Beauty transposase HTH domain-containing protein n=1 Tax=Cyclopterus lumpus TaxID=8103 RepID=A0A8C3ADE3_CYCLU
QKTKEHDVVQRQRVVDLWKDGKSEGAIGQELRMPKSTVHSIIVKYRLSNTVENLPRNGTVKAEKERRMPGEEVQKGPKDRAL